MAIIRWLHLSDFHVGKDNYGQRQVFKYILKHIQQKKNQGIDPDFIFITGDIGFSGRLDEYRQFTDEFIFPVGEILGEDIFERIYTIPGNHDVDRLQSKSVQRYNILEEIPYFLDPDERGVSERKNLFPRFKSFGQADLPYRNEWIFSKEGFSSECISIKGHTIGILRINTAWLSGSDQDQHHLSPGKGIVESGLDAIRQCDVRIVLGHHPIDWFVDKDLNAFYSMFGRDNVLYLHGHLHKNHLRYIEGAGYPFLALRAGACFQAREDERWVNGFSWHELNLESRHLVIEPLQWSKDNQEWSIDGSALPERYRAHGTDRWIIPLPGTRWSSSDSIPPSQKVQLTLPTGWQHIDKEFLSRYQSNVKDEQILRYFDGSLPGWDEALSPRIPRRAMVDELTAAVYEAQRQDKLGITLLTGAGGEGKSTVLCQAVCDLVNQGENWKIIWRRETDGAFPKSFFIRLPRLEGTYIIASDDAENIAQNVFEAADALRKTNRLSFHFLLCCRDTDWLHANANQLPRKYPGILFTTKRLRGLSLDDAKLIVNAWEKLGQNGLRELAAAKFDPEQAAQTLFAEAKSEKDADEGAFLGAMLRVRFGNGLKEHVKSVLLRLHERKAPPKPNGNLMDAFAYIAALHTKNLLVLSKPILASALQCSLGDIKDKVIVPLGEEAAIATTSRLILTRHREIAKAAVEILSSDLLQYLGKSEFDEIYIDLACAAEELKQSGVFVEYLDTFRNMSRYLFDEGEQSLGIRIAEELHKLRPDDMHYFVRLSQLYREARYPELSVRLFRNPLRVRYDRDRAYYYEWATAEGSYGNFGLDAWLCGVSLSDSIERRPPTVKMVVMALNGLTAVFLQLFNDSNQHDQWMIEACGAAAQLSRILDQRGTISSPAALRVREESLDICKTFSVDKVAVNVALERVHRSIRTAWEQREEDLPEWVTPGDQLSLAGFARLFGVDYSPLR
jgi:hypothetical protein